ncbi:bacillithiol biosynthesis deacetylase BshB1 [Scopulibacillus daqui]|uniref:Bacillithiol biosynthesis deacetylase BshB1 n=1 Tax=Scopulibacillus daqui TaxID=1469162 RepID=A0ABS2PYZ4_9BACL|nr:bacillithiol biosynthesis deacetylase BshB1 [Scopulibacillus daqui]MBM7645268.1 bacillithiol biosynthesis deacetylase BshB1 [Scopulibacillus daqui]
MEQVKLDILAFGAHPDDAEIGMGGTIALHTAKGFKVGICDLTKAELSSNGNIVMRAEEASQASDKLGLAVRENLGFPDRGLALDDLMIAKVVDVIRLYKPELVFAPYFEDRHPDHGHCGRLVEEAVFSAKIRKYQGAQGLPSHKVKDLYYYFINGFHKADFVVDITDVHKVKMDALKSYRSQFTLLDDNVETPLTNGYLEAVESRDRLYGKETETLFAEGFKTSRPLKRKYLIGESS